MKVEDITDWESPEVKTIEVTPDKGGSIFRLKVREFIPVEGDTLYRKWVSKGVKKTYDCPPYAIEDMRQAGIDLQRTIDENVASIVESEIDDTDTLFWNTYSMAFRYSHFAEVSQPNEGRQARILTAAILEGRREASVTICPATMGCHPHKTSRQAHLRPRNTGYDASDGGQKLLKFRKDPITPGDGRPIRIDNDCDGTCTSETISPRTTPRSYPREQTKQLVYHLSLLVHITTQRVIGHTRRDPLRYEAWQGGSRFHLACSSSRQG